MASSTATNSKYLDYAGLSHLKTVLDGRYATASHIHSYLPITGGALAGPLVFNGTDTDRNVIRVNCETGNADKIGDYGYTLKFLGSGSGVNNALALYADNSQATTQNLATKWLNDGTMYGRSILPHSNNTFDLGSSSIKWKNVYATTFNGNLTGNVTGSATKLGSTAISFTPADTALTPDNVYTLIGGTTIKRGSWSYAGNGYISNDTTGVGTIDLAGTTVIQADGGSSTAYTQLYLTPATGSTTGCKTNEIFMYNNNGSGYSPSWTRILTNRNYTDYCATVSHAHSYVASAGYSATSGRSTYSSSAGYSATSGRSTYSSSAGVAQYSGSAGYSATAGRSTYSGSAGFTQYSSSAGYSATAGRSIYSSTSGYAATAYNISSANLVTNETINTLTDDTVPVVPNIATTQIVNSGALRQFWVNVRNIIEDNEFVCASALTDLNTRLDNINASISLAAPVSTTKYNILGSPSTTGELNTAYCNSSVYMQGNNLYATSDARLKDFKEDIEVDLEKLRKLPKKYFTWKGESMMDIGTSAQELLKLYPELVSYDSVNDIYAVDYVKLSVIALAAVDTLYDRLKSTEDRLKVIEDKLAKLS